MTYRTLVALDACRMQREQYCQEHPRGLSLTESNLNREQRNYGCIWLVNQLVEVMRPAAKRRCVRLIDSYQREYLQRSQRGLILKAYPQYYQRIFKLAPELANPKNYTRKVWKELFG